MCTNWLRTQTGWLTWNQPTCVAGLLRHWSFPSHWWSWHSKSKPVRWKELLLVGGSLATVSFCPAVFLLLSVSFCHLRPQLREGLMKEDPPTLPPAYLKPPHSFWLVSHRSFHKESAFLPSSNLLPFAVPASPPLPKSFSDTLFLTPFTVLLARMAGMARTAMLAGIAMLTRLALPS